MSDEHNNLNTFEPIEENDEGQSNSERDLDILLESRYKRALQVNDQVEEKLNDVERTQYGDTYNQVRRIGPDAEAAFIAGLLPQLCPTSPDQDIDNLEISNYLRCWEILTAWVNQVVPGRSGQLDYIVRMLPILSPRDNPKD